MSQTAMGSAEPQVKQPCANTRGHPPLPCARDEVPPRHGHGHVPSDRKLEQDWVELLEHEPKFSCPIPRFGSSDYRRSRTSHLFFSKRRPSFSWFEQRVRTVFEPDVRAQRAVVAAGGVHHTTP
jgi:hypothetical protein